VFDVAGTASVFSCATDRFTPDILNKTVLCPRSAVSGLWIPIAYINGGGLCVRWARDVFFGTDGYGAMNNIIEETPPGSGGLVFVPHFAGRVCPYDPDIRGSYAGLTTAHGAGHMARAVMEAIGYEYCGYLDILENLTNRRFTEVSAIGGGARSRVFSQIKSDILGIPYVTLKSADTGVWGSAILGGVCAGVFSDPAEPARSAIIRTDTVRPNKNNYNIYQKYASVYRKQCEAQRDVYRDLRDI
jgi:xylulokinase